MEDEGICTPNTYTADPVGMGRKSRQYTIFQYTVHRHDFLVMSTGSAVPYVFDSIPTSSLMQAHLYTTPSSMGTFHHCQNSLSCSCRLCFVGGVHWSRWAESVPARRRILRGGWWRRRRRRRRWRLLCLPGPARRQTRCRYIILTLQVYVYTMVKSTSENYFAIIPLSILIECMYVPTDQLCDPTS